MNAPLNLFIFLMLIFFLVPLLFFYFKLRKKYYRLKIQEKRFDQINQEISKKQNELVLERRKVAEQKVKLEQEESRIKSEREKLVEESQRISEDKIFLEQERNKQRGRIQKVGMILQDERNKIDRKDEEVEDKLRKLEGEKESVEIEKTKLEAARKEINDASKQIQSEWQKIRLENDGLEKRKNELNEKENEIQEKEHQSLERKKFFDFEKERIKDEWKIIESKSEEFEKQVLNLDKRENEIIEKESRIENDLQQIQAEREKLKNYNDTLEKQAIELEEKEKQLGVRNQELVERENRIKDDEQRIISDRQLLVKEKEEIQKSGQRLKRKIESLIEHKNNLKSQGVKLKAIAEKIKNTNNWTTERIDEILKEIEELFPKPKPPTKQRLIPELICQKKVGYWQVTVKISGRLHDCSNIKITQDGSNLVKDELNENYYTLNSLSNVLIEWNDGDKSNKKKIQIYNNGDFKPLLFKLCSQNDNFGKFVNSPSTGSYLVIVPEDWRRDENKSGSAPAEPESISIKGFKGHFFILSKTFNNIIAFQNSAGELVSLEPKGSRFYLKGNPIIDANDEAGPLFGVEFPTIIDSIKSWNDIETIVIQEESDEINEHRWIISPENNSSEINLNKHEAQGDISLTQSTSSFFWVSIYDKDFHLIDSLHFRFIKGLKEIKISDHPHLPSSNGHQPVELIFLHDKSCTINIQKNENNRITINHDAEQTTAIIPPDSAWDLTDWEIKDGDGRKVNVELLVERIWWNLGNEEDPFISNDWLDKPIGIPREYFLPTSHHLISLQFPKPGWIKKIFVGIDERKKKEYRIYPTQRSVRIPLREFFDYKGFSTPDGATTFLLWIDKEGIQNKAEIVNIKSIEPPPPPPPAPPSLDNKPCCYNCNHARIKFKIYWCRRSSWPRKTYLYDDFIDAIAHFKCSEWRGEYWDVNGNYVSK